MIKLNKHISTFSLLMTGITAIIGSGWLLGTQKIANIAGPAGLISWGVGALVALIIGLLFVEMGTAYPSSGGIGYYTNVTHGRFCGFLTSWINWLSIVAVAPIEAQSIVQYLSQLSPHFHILYDTSSRELSHVGIASAVGLMVLFTFVNYWSVKFFIRFNNFFTVIKIFVPLLTIVALAYNGFHTHNFSIAHEGGFMPFGVKSIFVSVVTCGVVMSFNGFQSPLTFAEEIKSPRKMLPIAVAGSILIALVLYLLLQVVFIGSLNPADLVHGWNGVNFRSPYIDLLMAANMQIMVTIVYAGSVISPGVCGSAFVASGSRIMYSLAREGHLPQFLSRIHPVFKTPRNAILACMLIGCIFLFLFRGWYQLVAVISVIHLFSYVPAPIVVIANRMKNRGKVNKTNQFVMPFAHIISPVFLFVLSLLLFFAGWPLIPELLVLLIPGIFLFIYYENRNQAEKDMLAAIKGVSWLLFYFIGLCLIVYYGENPQHSVLSMHGSLICLLILSFITYIFGAFYAWDKRKYVIRH